MDSLLYITFVYLLMAVVIVPLSQRFGLGSVLGYLLAGVIIGPVSGILGDHHGLLAIGEIGVVMMLFLIGLELEPRLLWQMRFQLLGMGGLQIVASTLLIALFTLLLIPVWQQALAVGLILALSSTAIVIQTLNEKRLNKTPAGQSMFAVLLMQDVTVIPILALMSLLAVATDASLLSGLAKSGFWDLVYEGGYALMVLAVICAFVGVGYLLSRPVLHYIARTDIREMFTATALLFVVGSALLMHTLHLSPALGTFVAGMVLARSEYVHEIRASIEPFKGLLLGLFFVGVGMGMDIGLLATRPVELFAAGLALILIKMAILLAIARLFRMERVSSWLFALGLAQAGEFGFVLLAFALGSGIMDEQLANEIVLVITLSMLMTPLLFIIYGLLERRHGTHSAKDSKDGVWHDSAVPPAGKVCIVGTGRFGRIVHRILKADDFAVTMVDKDALMLRPTANKDVRPYFGDATRPHLLDSIALDQARLLIVAIDDVAASLQVVEYVRRSYPDLQILARAYDRHHLFQLRKSGADMVVRETLDSAVRCATSALAMLGVDKTLAIEKGREYSEQEMEHTDRLYELWHSDLEAMEQSARKFSKVWMKRLVRKTLRKTRRTPTL